jgi:hypothetical protein
MRQYPGRIEPLHEDGTCGELDVMVVREISLRNSRLVRVALDNLGEYTGGLVKPISIGEIPFPIFGGPPLKRAVLDKVPKIGSRSKKSVVTSMKKMDEVLDKITDRHDFHNLELDLADPEAPFRIDEYDRLVISLDDSNEQLAEDRERILEALVNILEDVDQDEIDNITYFKPPAIVVGEVQRHMLGLGEGQAEFVRNPNPRLAELITEGLNTVDADGFRIEKEIFPSSVCFGALNIVARKRVPAVEAKLKIIESPLAGTYDGARLVKHSQVTEDDYLDEVG